MVGFSSAMVHGMACASFGSIDKRGRRTAYRKHDAEHGSSAGAVGGGNGTAVRFNDPAADRQPQTRPPAGPGSADTEKLFEYTLLGPAGQPGAAIGHLNRHRP